MKIPSTEEITLKTPSVFRRAPQAKTRSKDWVQVSLLWKGELVDVKCFDRGEVVTLGDNPQNHFVISLPSLPPTFSLLKILPNGIEIQHHPAIRGVIETKGKTISLDELQKSARPTDLGLSSFFQFQDRCLLEIQPFTLYVQSVKLELQKPLTAPLIKDPLFAKILSGVTLLLGFFFIILQLLDSPPEKQEEEKKLLEVKLENIPKLPSREIPSRGVAGPKASSKVNLKGKEGGGARAQGSEGKRGKKEEKIKISGRPLGFVTKRSEVKKMTGEGGQMAPTKEPKPKVNVEDIGIFGGLKKGGGEKGIGELKDLTEGLERGSDVSAKGTGGRGSAGAGSGGGGSSIDVGGLGTQGKGGGREGFGLGSSGTKGEAEVTYTMQEVEVRDGLTRDEIARVVYQHQAEIQLCYEKAISENNQLGGRIKVSWFVNSEGKAENVAEQSGISGGVALFRCIAQKISNWQFPLPRGGRGAQVSWPWVFRRGE